MLFLKRLFWDFIKIILCQSQQVAAHFVSITNSRLHHRLGHAATCGKLKVEASVISHLGQKRHDLYGGMYVKIFRKEAEDQVNGQLGAEIDQYQGAQ